MTQPTRVNGYTREELDRMCQGKHRWPDDLSARAGGLQSLERRPETKRLYTYKCPACAGYHLTRCKQKGQQPITLEPNPCIQQEKKKGFPDFPVDGALCRATNDRVKG